MQFTFTETEVMMLQSYPETFELIGTIVEVISSTCVKVHSAPLSFFEKVSSEVSCKLILQFMYGFSGVLISRTKDYD